MEELELIRLAQAGCRKSQDKLLRMHKGFIYNMIRKYSIPGHDQDDLFQIASLGLLKAIQLYDPSKGVKLLTYAVHQIRAKLCHALTGSRTKMRCAQEISLDEPMKESGVPLIETMMLREESPFDDDDQLAEIAKKHINRLKNPKYRECALTFLETFDSEDEITLKEIGYRFNLSREAVRLRRNSYSKQRAMVELKELLVA